MECVLSTQCRIIRCVFLKHVAHYMVRFSQALTHRAVCFMSSSDALYGAFYSPYAALQNVPRLWRLPTGVTCHIALHVTLLLGWDLRRGCSCCHCGWEKGERELDGNPGPQQL
ncbi:hypothetical protein VNO77_35197 [Canavalia gladiata]|uniref:Uncharacterized protein n=1 Tax=Canavalia gladiata TaxID=3824 RepID=A0AAN9PZL0_CANGL